MYYPFLMLPIASPGYGMFTVGGQWEEQKQRKEELRENHFRTKTGKAVTPTCLSNPAVDLMPIPVLKA
ncbi:hypothetical protein TNCV_3611641 [Trichonephila clavipes]|nr:hypothetical protein TNCV_3611641 [Trichonephila clavipes]